MQYFIKNKTKQAVAVEELGVGAVIKPGGMIGPYDDMVLRKIAGPRSDIAFVPVVAEGNDVPAAKAALKTETVSFDPGGEESSPADDFTKPRRRKAS